MTRPVARCPVCGHLLRSDNVQGWICSAQGGCRSEWDAITVLADAPTFGLPASVPGCTLPLEVEARDVAVAQDVAANGGTLIDPREFAHARRFERRGSAWSRRRAEASIAEGAWHRYDGEAVHAHDDGSIYVERITVMS